MLGTRFRLYTHSDRGPLISLLNAEKVAQIKALSNKWGLVHEVRITVGLIRTIAQVERTDMVMDTPR